MVEEAARGAQAPGTQKQAGTLLAQRGQAAVQAAAGEESEWVQLDCDFWASIDAAGRPAGGYPFRYFSYAQLVLRMRALPPPPY